VRSFDWYFDVVSPFSFLHFQRLSALADAGNVRFVAKPILLGAVFAQTGNVGPAEIPSKRAFAYRFITFQAQQMGHPLCFPPTHPFNPLLALRFICAVDDARRNAAAGAALDVIWKQGKALDQIEHFAALAQAFELDLNRLADPEVKARLKDNTEAALAAGVFGVPTAVVEFAHGNELFFGLDATDYLLAALQDPSIMSNAEAQRLLTLTASAERKR
jgi:2-hydroxychromene-2-carboxylate isomerase